MYVFRHNMVRAVFSSYIHVVQLLKKVHFNSARKFKLLLQVSYRILNFRKNNIFTKCADNIIVYDHLKIIFLLAKNKNTI